MRETKRFAILALAVLLAALAAPAAAQLQTGNLFGIVEDIAGAPLPGATVTLSGSGAPAVQTTDDKGQFRFPGLPPGIYRVVAELDGFIAAKDEAVIVSVGRNTSIEL